MRHGIGQKRINSFEGIKEILTYDLLTLYNSNLKILVVLDASDYDIV